MAVGIGASIGRVRVTRTVSPGEPGYVRSMRIQMDEIARVLKDTIKKVKGVTGPGIAYALEPIMDLSQEYVPKDTLALMKSGFIEVREGVNGPTAMIGYAKHGVPHYAAFVHEMIHVPHKPGETAKFLERAVNEKLDIFRKRLINYIKGNTGFQN